MGIYSKPKNYLFESIDENHLLEDANDSVNLKDIKEAVEDIENIELDESTKINMIKYLLGESVTDILNESVVLEYSGNETKNEEFKEILKEVDELIEFFMGTIRSFAKYFGKIDTDVKYILEHPNSFKTKLEDIKGYPKAHMDDYNERQKNINGQVTWGKFRSKVKSFNNKYSSVIMEEKKRLDKKLDNCLDEIETIARPWVNGDKINIFIGNLAKLKEIDEDYQKSVVNIAGGLQDALIKECNYTFGDIQYTRKAMNIKAENGLLYKIINKIKK